MFHGYFGSIQYFGKSCDQFYTHKLICKLDGFNCLLYFDDLTQFSRSARILHY